MKNQQFTFLVFFILLYSCGTKMVTYLDTDKSHIMGNSNIVYIDSTLKFMCSFLPYSGDDLKVYDGIELDLTLLKKDTSVQIENLDVQIKPSKNTDFIKPISFLFSDIVSLEQSEAKEFASLKPAINFSKDPTVNILFADDVELYDTLHATFYVLYFANGKQHEVMKSKEYIKRYYRKPLTR